MTNLHNHDVYLPRYFDQDTERVSNLFPSYLFVRILNGQFSFLNYAFGIAHVVMFGDKPASVHHKVINYLKTNEQDGLVKVGLRRFNRGDKVRILSGPFINQSGVFDSYRPRKHLRILVTAFGLQTAVLLRARQCECGD